MRSYFYQWYRPQQNHLQICIRKHNMLGLLDAPAAWMYYQDHQMQFTEQSVHFRQADPCRLLKEHWDLAKK